jgi:hypothetical protein
VLNTWFLPVYQQEFITIRVQDYDVQIFKEYIVIDGNMVHNGEINKLKDILSGNHGLKIQSDKKLFDISFPDTFKIGCTLFVYEDLVKISAKQKLL